MNILLLLQKMLKDKVKILLMMVTIIWIVIPISWNKLSLNLTQVWNVNSQQQKKLNEFPQNKKLVWVRRDNYKDPKNKLPFRKFSNKLHM